MISSCLSIPISRVSEKLVDRLKECFRARPELAFGDKDIASIASDKDVGFSGEIKRFSRCLSFVVTVQLDQNVIPQRFLIHLAESAWTPLHNEHHIFNDRQDVVVFFI